MTAELDRLRRRGRFVALADELEARARPPAEAIGGPFREGGRDLGEDADALHELGRVQWQLARFAAAEQSLGRALAIREDLLGDGDPRTIDTRERLAALYHYRGDARAEPLFERVLAARDPGSVAHAITERNLGAYLRDAGHTGRAFALLDRAVRVLGERLDGEHPEYAAALKARAFLGQLTGGTEAAEAERAYEIAIRAHDVDHPFAASALLLVARVERAHRRLRDARAHVEHALATLRAGYGDDHPLVAIAHGDLGDVRHSDDDPDGALAAWQTAFAMHARWYPRSGHVATLGHRIAATLAATGDRPGARVWYERAHAVVGDDPDALRAQIGDLLVVAEAAASRGDRALVRDLLARARELDEPALEWRDHITNTELVIAELLAEQPD